MLEWSPINDKSLAISEDWTTDTLFSAINVPFPFPDSREIGKNQQELKSIGNNSFYVFFVILWFGNLRVFLARGAGIADFIQPSLGPLQPNLDDIDLTIVGKYLIYIKLQRKATNCLLLLM